MEKYEVQPWGTTCSGIIHLILFSCDSYSYHPGCKDRTRKQNKTKQIRHKIKSHKACTQSYENHNG